MQVIYSSSLKIRLDPKFLIRRSVGIRDRPATSTIYRRSNRKFSIHHPNQHPAQILGVRYSGLATADSFPSVALHQIMHCPAKTDPRPPTFPNQINDPGPRSCGVPLPSGDPAPARRRTARPTTSSTYLPCRWRGRVFYAVGAILISKPTWRTALLYLLSCSVSKVVGLIPLKLRFRAAKHMGYRATWGST